MERQVRSPAFDLLFDDSQHARVAAIRPYLADPTKAPATIPLHRVTVFLTYGCNLSCPYCKTIVRGDDLILRPQKGTVLTFEHFTGIIERLADTPLAHLHFTGGEPTLIATLPAMIQYAKRHGVQHCSLTSNGTLPVHRYMNCVAAGLDEIRISLDAADPELGALMTGGKRSAWQRAVNTIRSLIQWQAEGAAFFLLANAVIAEVNRYAMVSIVRFLLDLGVGDLRLLCVADQKETLWDFPEATAVVEQLQQLLAQYPPTQFPLLRCKVASVFAPEETGVQTVHSALGDAWRCYIPLTERTYDGMYYYPCSNYLREGGAPLGHCEEPWEQQHQTTLTFVEQFVPMQDPICQRYCSHCTKQFNMRANEARLR